MVIDVAEVAGSRRAVTQEGALQFCRRDPLRDPTTNTFAEDGVETNAKSVEGIPTRLRRATVTPHVTSRRDSSSARPFRRRPSRPWNRRPRRLREKAAQVRRRCIRSRRGAANWTITGRGRRFESARSRKSCRNSCSDDDVESGASGFRPAPAGPAVDERARQLRRSHLVAAHLRSRTTSVTGLGRAPSRVE